MRAPIAADPPLNLAFNGLISLVKSSNLRPRREDFDFEEEAAAEEEREGAKVEDVAVAAIVR
jgi:hypothetical protein